MKIIKNNLILIIIVFLAAFLRFYHLGTNPPALSWDEVAWGYNAYSLGLTARDEFGRLLPWDYLESFGDFKPPVYAYLAILPVKIFGLNEFATRFPSAFFGTLTVLLTYFLVKELFSKQPFTYHLSLFTSFLLAISPWHIMLSRAAFEANVATFFLITGVTLFLKGARSGKWYFPFSAVSFALSLQTFNTSRIVAPLLVLLLAIHFRKKLWSEKKWTAVSLLVGFVILFPVLSFYLTPQARLRFKEVNIFSDQGLVIEANQEIANDKMAWWSSIIHNRRWGFARLFLQHYFDHFKPSFLFFNGDGNPKFSTQYVGELYLWEAVFLVTGTLILLKKRTGYWWLIPCWLLIGILPAATARETPHALRIETTLPTWQILTALGAVSFLDWFRKLEIRKIFKSLFFIFCFSFFVFNIFYFQHGYWRHYPIEFSGEWQYGYKPALEYIKEVNGKYDQIWFTDQLGRPYIYFLFYLQEKPSDFWSEAKIEHDPFGFVKVDSFKKYHFFRSETIPLTKNKILVFDFPRNVPDKVEPIKTFYLLNGQKILQAYVLTTNEVKD